MNPLEPYLPDGLRLVLFLDEPRRASEKIGDNRGPLATVRSR
jgi:hypothetical protein